MIERDFVKQKKREFQVMRYITSTLRNVGHSFTELQRTPLGDKVIIHTQMQLRPHRRQDEGCAAGV